MMKNTKLMAMAALLLSTTAFGKSLSPLNNGKNNSSKSTHTIDTARMTRSAPRDGGESFGLGVTTNTGVMSGSGGVMAALGGGLSSLIPMGNHYLQTSLGVAVSTTFSFGLASTFKATVAGTSDSGFHVGGGIGLGIEPGPMASTFFFNLHGVAGVHHEIANRVQISFDAGPIIAITPAPVAITLQPFSGIAGFSVHYML